MGTFLHGLSDADFLVAQMAKCRPTMRETWLQTLGWEDLLEKEMVTHSSILAWRIPMDRGTCQTTVHGVAKCHVTERARAHTHTRTHTHAHTHAQAQ